MNVLGNESRVPEMLSQKQNQIKAEVKAFQVELKALVDGMSNPSGILPSTWNKVLSTRQPKTKKGLLRGFQGQSYNSYSPATDHLTPLGVFFFPFSQKNKHLYRKTCKYGIMSKL